MNYGLGNVGSSYSPFLKRLFFGHGLDPEFAPGEQAFSMLQLARKAECDVPWDSRLEKGTWLHNVNAWLANFNWTPIAAWTWQHSEFGDLRCSDPATLNLPKARHLLREAWRQHLFQSFLQQTRRDSHALNHAQCAYNSNRCQEARSLARKLGTHAVAVLSGGAISDAVYEIMQGKQEATAYCWHCKSEQVSTWDHVVWFCGAFSQTRVPTPEDALQRRLGWPMPQDKFYDAQVLHHLAVVRQRVLDARWRPNDFEAG